GRPCAAALRPQAYTPRSLVNQDADAPGVTFRPDFDQRAELRPRPICVAGVGCLVRSQLRDAIGSTPAFPRRIAYPDVVERLTGSVRELDYLARHSAWSGDRLHDDRRCIGCPELRPGPVGCSAQGRKSRGYNNADQKSVSRKEKDLHHRTPWLNLGNGHY